MSKIIRYSLEHSFWNNKNNLIYCCKNDRYLWIYPKLRLSHFIDSKQLRFIQRIGFYINDLVVYKIAVVVNPLTLKKSSKYQLPQHYNFHYDDFEHVKIKEPFKDTSKGRYILMYEVPKNEIYVCQGEDY